MTQWWPRHACGLSLEHNPNRDYYEKVINHIENMESVGNAYSWPSPAERERSIAINEIWILQWYPDTPRSSYCCAAASFDVLMDFVEKEFYGK